MHSTKQQVMGFWCECDELPNYKPRIFAGQCDFTYDTMRTMADRDQTQYALKYKAKSVKVNL